MSGRFETLRFALAQADTHGKPYVQVTRDELGALVTDHDRMVEAIRAGGFTSLADVRGGPALCICDPMRGVTCATHAEQARAASQGRPMVDETAARAAGWVPLADVLAALDEYDHDWDSPGARDVCAFLAERFGAAQTKEASGG